MTFTLTGNGCTVYGCFISPSMESDSPWGSQLPEFPPSDPIYYVSTHATLKTGLPVSITGYRSIAAIPTDASGSGSGTFDWFIGNGTSGSFTVPLTSTWVANGKVGNYARFLETVVSETSSNGESVCFTRDWYATPGERGFLSLHILDVSSADIGPKMNLTLPDSSMEHKEIDTVTVT